MNKTTTSLIILFIATTLIMLRQLLSSGYFSIIVNDVYTYTNWAWQFNEGLKEGLIYPRWLPLDFWEYGAPIFILYPPLAYYLTAFFNIFTDSIVLAMNVTKYTGLLFSVVGMFFLIKEFHSNKIALLTASFYLIFPYTVFQFYLIGTFSSIVSFMWFSPIFLFIYRYIKRDKVEYLLYGCLCFSGLIISHLINAYMFSFVLILFIVYFSLMRKNIKTLIAIPVIISAGLLISSAYILPLIFENKFLRLASFTGESVGIHYTDIFIFSDLPVRIPIDSFWRIYHDAFISYVFLFLAILCIFIYRLIKVRQYAEKNIKEISLFFIFASIFTIFFLFSISTFFWETVPYFEYIQFPLRWLNITNFTVSFLSSVLFCSLQPHYRTIKISRVFVVSVFLIFLLLDLRYIIYAHILPQHNLIPVKIHNSNLEHLPIWAVKDNISSHTINYRIEIVKGEGKSEILTWKSAERIIKISSEQPIMAKVQTFYFPGWKAYLNGTEIAIKIESATGAMLIDIPKGDHMLELKFVDTPVRFYGKLISLLSLVAVGGFLLREKMRKSSKLKI